MAKALYPDIRIDRNKTPNRWYAIPFVGFLFKLIIVIPVSIEISVLHVVVFLLSILNALGIFFKGRYWKLAYEVNVGTIQLETNVSYFLYGLTDRYPGFSLTTTNYSLQLPFPKKPNRLFAFPLLGFVARYILMIPYMIYSQIVALGATLAMFVSWIPVLGKAYYPESTYEIARDGVRLQQAVTAYFLGLSDEYPSFWISMNHKAIKIVLLTAAVIFFLMTFFTPASSPKNHQPTRQSQYSNTQTTY